MREAGVARSIFRQPEFMCPPCRAGTRSPRLCFGDLDERLGVPNFAGFRWYRRTGFTRVIRLNNSRLPQLADDVSPIRRHITNLLKRRERAYAARVSDG